MATAVLAAPISLHAESPTAQVAAAHAGTGLTRAYDGKGVTVAIIDQGFDPNHIAFTTPGDPSKTRVVSYYVWNGSSLVATPLADATTDTGTDYHGTHVAGIAAGGYDGPARYNDGNGVKDYDHMPLVGVAPNADIIITGAGKDLSSSMIGAAVKRLCDGYQPGVDKPLVINMSMGDIKGSHNGSGSGATGFSEVYKYASSGPIFCIAAGNEGRAEVAFNVTGPDTYIVGLPFGTTQQNVSVYASLKPKAGYEGATDLTTRMVESAIQFDFVVYDTVDGTIVYSRNIDELYNTVQRSMGGSGTRELGREVNEDFDTWFSRDSYIAISNYGVNNTVAYGMPPAHLTEKSEWEYSVGNMFKANSESRYKPGLRIVCPEGKQAYGYVTSGTLVSHDVPGWHKGSAYGSITALSTIDNVISVGACCDAERIGYLNGNSYDSTYKPGEIWPMSSYGFNASTGEALPHVVAPGYNIVSAANRYCNTTSFNATATYDGTTYNWTDASGTSMATPFVSGTIALWLQADPTLTVADIKEVFRHTNTYPAEIESLPANDPLRRQWGGGMIQPLDGLKYIINSSGLSTPATAAVAIDRTDTEITVTGTGAISATLSAISGLTVANVAGYDSISLPVATVARGLYILSIRTEGGKITEKIRL